MKHPFIFFALTIFSAPAMANQLKCVTEERDRTVANIYAHFRNEFREVSNIDMVLVRTDNGFRLHDYLRPAGYGVIRGSKIFLSGESTYYRMAINASFSPNGKYTGEIEIESIPEEAHQIRSESSPSIKLERESYPITCDLE